MNALATHIKFAGRAQFYPEPEKHARCMEEENLNTHTLTKRKENRMSIYKNSGVIEAWDHNEAARNHRNTLHTDGKKLFSYSLQIGDTCQETGRKFLKNYTAKGRHGFQSQTTSCHVGLAARTVEEIVVV